MFMLNVYTRRFPTLMSRNRQQQVNEAAITSPQMVDDWRHVVVEEISSMTWLIQPLVLVEDEAEATGSPPVGDGDSGCAMHLCLCTLNQQGSVCQGDPDPHPTSQL